RDGDERARQGFGVHRAPAGGRDTLAKATDKTNRKGSERAVRALVLINASIGRISALGANRTRRDGGNDVNDPIRTLGACAYTRFKECQDPLPACRLGALQ